MLDRRLSAPPLAAPRRFRGWALRLAAFGLSAVAAPGAKADVTYDFTIGPDATGFFTTGAASPVDPGYFLLTGIELTSISGTTLADGPFSLTDQVADAPDRPGNTNGGYDPSTGSFINHFGGAVFYDSGTFDTQDISDFSGLGSSPPYEGNVSTLPDPNQVDDNLFRLDGSLVIVPATVTAAPEPASLALLGAGLLAVFGAARRTARRG